MRFLAAYLATACTFIVVDLIWLGVIAKGFYRQQMGGLLADPINWKAGIAFYLLYPIGVVVFAVAPAMASPSWTSALALGTMLGLFAYGTYDMTNLATLKGWPVTLAIVDMLWGAALTGTAATAGYLAMRG